MIKVIINKLQVAIFLMLSQPLLAANFTITPSGTLPTTVNIGQTVSAFYTVHNNTHSTRMGYQVQGLPPTVVQNATPPNCPNPIVLGPQASCQLQLDITGAVSSNFAICNGNSCTTSATPLNVSVVPQSQTFAYVTQGDAEGVMVCSVSNTDGSLQSCTDAGGNLNTARPQGIVVDNSGKYAFITEGLTFTHSVNQCVINQSTHTFDSCSATQITSPSYSSQIGLLTLNIDGTFAYIVSNGPARILACPITNGVIGSVCVNTGATNLSTSNDNVGIVLNSTQTTAYIGNSSATDNFITVCSVSGNVFNNCIRKSGDGGAVSFFTPSGVALNPTGTLLYVADELSNTVYACDTTSNNTPFFNNCIIASSQISDPWDITINKTGTIAYITDNNALVSTCPILADGTLGVCTQTGFPQPVSVALH